MAATRTPYAAEYRRVSQLVDEDAAHHGLEPFAGGEILADGGSIGGEPHMPTVGIEWGYIRGW